MDTILCSFSMFDRTQNIIIRYSNGTEKTISSDMDHLGEDIAKLCELENIDTVHLFGNVPYAETFIKPSIIDMAENKYRFKNEIKVEINQ